MCFLLIISSPIIKLVVTSSHFHSKIPKDNNNILDFWYSIFTYWHVRHLSTHSTISFSILGHQKVHFATWYIFQRRIMNLELCSLQVPHSLPNNQILPWYLICIYSSMEKRSFPYIAFITYYSYHVFSFWCTNQFYQFQTYYYITNQSMSLWLRISICKLFYKSPNTHHYSSNLYLMTQRICHYICFTRIIQHMKVIIC